MRRVTSSKPRKQRKFLKRGYLHLLRKNLVLHISKKLREKLQLKEKRILAKSGLKVRVVKGKNKGREGSVARVSIKKQKIYIEGLSHRNARGREKLVAISPYNVEIIDEKINDFIKGKKLVRDSTKPLKDNQEQAQEQLAVQANQGNVSNVVESQANKNLK
ncbi:MAG: 50S ribosomal protein L24 [Candidatus Micrarchaeota archaeon]|nr:50S ribosomal protein L24 [Candidatus Micrarchaeota archaeon]